MLTTVIQALFYFLPAYIANACPVLFARLGWWKRLAVPIDGGRRLGEEFIFGSTKTWRGVISGIIGGLLTGLGQWIIFVCVTDGAGFIFLTDYTFVFGILLGGLMGLGEGFGDLVKSFIKRRLGMKSSAHSFGLDQTSFLGALALSLIVFLPSGSHILAILILSPLFPVIANVAAFKLGWKKVWW